MGIGREIEFYVSNGISQLLEPKLRIRMQARSGNYEQPVRVPNRPSDQSGVVFQLSVICLRVSVVVIDSEIAVPAKCSKTSINPIQTGNESGGGKVTPIQDIRCGNAALLDVPYADLGLP
tara:strand:- start:8 stop:367 length:360 start_codon:yes stop_codon:yes gene_type:complete